MPYTAYPNAIDTTTQLPIIVDQNTLVRAEVVNRHRDAILAVENELGVNPSGTFSTVKDRLANTDLVISTTVNGKATVSCDSSVNVDDLVYSNGGVMYTASSSSVSTAPAVGYVITKPSVTTCTIQTTGLLSYTGLIAGAIYYLSSSGTLTTTPTISSGYVVQPVGAAINSTNLSLNFSDYIIL